jgi:hypothetical protein
VHPESWNRIPPSPCISNVEALHAWIGVLGLGDVEFMLETNVEMIADEVFCRMPNNGSQRRRPAATSCYRQTHDVLNQSLERRDVLCFHNEYSDEVE